MKYCIDCLQRKFEDAKVLIRRRKPKEKGQTSFYKILLTIEEHEPP